MRGVAIITDGTICSKDFLKEFMMELHQSENNKKIFLNLQSFSMSSNNVNEKKLKEFFYSLKTGATPLIVLLVPPEYIASMFKISEFYGLNGPAQTWLIPAYMDGFATTSIPERILTFKVLNTIKTPYANLQKDIPRLLAAVEKTEKNT